MAGQFRLSVLIFAMRKRLSQYGAAFLILPAGGLLLVGDATPRQARASAGFSRHAN